MADQQTWLLKTPQDLLNEYHETHGVWRADISVSVHIIDSEKLFVVRKGHKYYVPEYTFTPSAVSSESMEFYAFKLVQPYIAAKGLRQVRFVDLAFPFPLVHTEQRSPGDKTLRISLVVMAQCGKSLINDDIREVTDERFEGCDWFSFQEMGSYLQPDRVYENLRAIWRYKNFMPRVKNILQEYQPGVVETPAFRSLCSRTICSAIRADELRHRRSLEKGYICLRKESNGWLYLFPFVNNIMPSWRQENRKVIAFGGVEYEVLGKWIKPRDLFMPIEVRPGADTAPLWLQVFNGEGSMNIELLDVGHDDALWPSPVWQDAEGVVDSVPKWVNKDHGRWVLQE